MGEEITTATAAELLGVTDARVRQIVASGAISARRLGPRIVLLDEAEVLLHRDCDTGIVTETTGVAATATTSGALPLLDDHIEAIEDGPWGRLGLVHVRIWGTQDRTVVVIGPVADSPLNPSSWHLGELIAPHLIASTDVTDLRGPTSIWLTVGAGVDGLPQLANPVLLGRARDRVRWLGPVNWAAAERCLGQQLRVFPDRQLATPENIAAVAAAGPDQLPLHVDPAAGAGRPPKAARQPRWVRDAAVSHRSLVLPSAAHEDHTPTSNDDRPPETVAALAQSQQRPHSTKKDR